MSRQALRSVYSQTRPEVYQTGQAVKNYFCQFSTTQSLAAEADGAGQPSNPNPNTGRPTIRQRTRAAASEISSLVRGRGRGASAGANRTPPLEGASTGPRVIDVRSLPRGGLARGRGGLRGRGTFAGATRGGSSNANASSSPTSGNRFSQPNRGSFAPGGRGGRGAQGARGARGARGGAQRGAAGRGRGRGRGGKGPKKQESHEERMARRQDPFERMDAAEKEFDDAMTFGTRTTYTPCLSLESLSQFVPTITSTPRGRSATVLQNLSTLGSADPVASPQGLQASNLAEDLERDGIRFFADVKSLEAAEEHLQKKREAEAVDGDTTEASQNKGRIIGAAEESIKKVITEQAIEGKHETPRFAMDPVGVARSWHLRAETYTQRDTDKFEKKLSSLIGGSKKGGAKAQAKA